MNWIIVLLGFLTILYFINTPFFKHLKPLSKCVYITAIIEFIIILVLIVDKYYPS